MPDYPESPLMFGNFVRCIHVEVKHFKAVLLSGGCADAVFALGTDSGLRISDLPDSNHCKFAFWSPFNTIIRSFLGEAKKIT